MTPVLVSVDKAGDLKLGRKKCRLHKKADVVKVAKKYGIVQRRKENCQGVMWFHQDQGQGQQRWYEQCSPSQVVPRGCQEAGGG